MNVEKIEKILPALLSGLAKCQLCPHRCGVNRLENEQGFCKTGRYSKIASYGPHYGEEIPISGNRGSGTVFFSNCNMACSYCQNYEISQKGRGEIVSPEKLAQIFLELSRWGCHNLNLVSPTHVLPQILEGLKIAANQGWSLPIVYNTGGYDSPEIIAMLDGIVDIYMPDMKYGSSKNGLTYSNIQDYSKFNQRSVINMFRQVGNLKMDGRGIAYRGLLIRHLILPHQLAASEAVFKFIAANLSRETFVNIMDQYHPAYKGKYIQELNRSINIKEFHEAISLADKCGLKNIRDF